MEALYTTIQKCQFSPRISVTSIPIFKLNFGGTVSMLAAQFQGRLAWTGSKEGIWATAARNMLKPPAVFMQIFSLPEKDEERRSTSSVTVKLQACFSVGPEHQEVVGLLSREKTNRPTSSSQTSIWEHSWERTSHPIWARGHSLWCAPFTLDVTLKLTTSHL